MIYSRFAPTKPASVFPAREKRRFFAFNTMGMWRAHRNCFRQHHAMTLKEHHADRHWWLFSENEVLRPLTKSQPGIPGFSSSNSQIFQVGPVRAVVALRHLEQHFGSLVKIESTHRLGRFRSKPRRLARRWEFCGRWFMIQDLKPLDRARSGRIMRLRNQQFHWAI